MDMGGGLLVGEKNVHVLIYVNTVMIRAYATDE